MNQFIIDFLAAGFKQSFDIFKTELINYLEPKFMTLNEQINELKVGQELNNQKIQSLIAASTQEREQVGSLVSITQSQQTTIVELTTKVNELLGMVDVNEANNATAAEAVAALLATTNEQSAMIDEAIAGIQEIYNPA